MSNLEKVVPIDREERNRLVRGLVIKSGNEDQIRLVLAICDRYSFDPLLKHVVLINGNVYVTRDGLLHVAHATGQLDGIVIDELREETDDKGKVIRARAKVSVFRKDMRHPFTYWGRASVADIANKDYVSEMAVKRGEVMALRRAFDVSLCGVDELSDREQAGADFIADRTEVALDYIKGARNLEQLQLRYRQMLAKPGVLVEALQETFESLAAEFARPVIDAQPIVAGGDVVDGATGEILDSDQPEVREAIAEANPAEAAMEAAAASAEPVKTGGRRK